MGTTALEVIINIENVIKEAESDAAAVVAYVSNLIAQFHANSQEDIDTLHDAALKAAKAEAPQDAIALDEGADAPKAKASKP